LLPVRVAHDLAGRAFSPMRCIPMKVARVIDSSVAILAAGTGAYLCASFPRIECTVTPVDCCGLQAAGPS
jgi:hypothetical protein